MNATNRPLSPHLQIMKPQWTWVPSILHRATGIGLGAGALLLVAWLVALASGPRAYALAQGLLSSPVGQLLLLGFTWALVYHVGAGVRHLFWDIGVGLELRTAERTAKVVVYGSFVATALIWLIAYFV